MFSPLGVSTTIKALDNGYELTLDGSVTALDGSDQQRIKVTSVLVGDRDGMIQLAQELGKTVALGLKARGADKILKSIK